MTITTQKAEHARTALCSDTVEVQKSCEATRSKVAVLGRVDAIVLHIGFAYWNYHLASIVEVTLLNFP